MQQFPQQHKRNGDAVVRELTSLDDWTAGFQALQALRPNLSLEMFLERRAHLMSGGYRLLGIFCDNQVVSIASFLITPHPVLIRELQIHDMATLTTEQGKGWGRIMLAKLDEIAHLEGCGRIFVHTVNATEFYKANGFTSYSSALIKTPVPK